MTVTQDIMETLAVSKERAAEVHHGMLCSNLDFSECTKSEFRYAAREALVEIQAKEDVGREADDYMNDMLRLGMKLEQLFGGKAKLVSYSGGVPRMSINLPGMSINLPAKKYEAVKKQLTTEFGEPKVVKSWHPQHTKRMPPLTFQLTPEMYHLEIDHIHLIHMMQWKKKQYITICWM